MNRVWVSTVLVIAGLCGLVSPASGQVRPAGPVVMKNDCTAEVTITNFKYVDSFGGTREVSGTWKLKPGFYGYLTHGAGQNKIVASKIMYDVFTAEGKSANWSCESTGLDADGDFASRFTQENLTVHLNELGKAPVFAFKPAVPLAAAGPTEEQIARGVVKALGAAVLHEKAKQVPADFADAFAVELARAARDELIKSAIDDLFPQLPTRDRATLGRLVPLALDDRLTDDSLREAEARDAIVAYLQKQNPDFALAAQAADFLYRVQQGAN